MANTLAYHNTTTTTTVKSFVVWVPGGNLIKLFFFVIESLETWLVLVLGYLAKSSISRKDRTFPNGAPNNALPYW